MAEIESANAPPTFDLINGKPKDFEPWLNNLHKWIAANPKDVVLPQNGWYDITPEVGLDFLRLDKPGANREVALATVRYYGGQMIAGEWQETGQPILIASNKTLLDARHRLLAGLLSGTTFRSYVITDVVYKERLFACIDNSRSRNAAAALETAGYNGRSATVANVIKMIDQFEAGAFTPTSVHSRARMTPLQYLLVADRHPLVKKACALVSGPYQDFVPMFLGHKAALAFFVMMILEAYDQDVADSFFFELEEADPAEYSKTSPNDPLTILRWILAAEARKENQLKAHQVLGYVIKAFNMWQDKSQSKRISLRVDEAFPMISAPNERISEEDEDDAVPAAQQQAEASV